MNEVLEAAKKVVELIAALNLKDAKISVGEAYDPANPKVNVYVSYMKANGDESHRSVYVSKYCANPPSIYTCGWFPEGMFHNVILPLEKMGYRASI